MNCEIRNVTENSFVVACAYDNTFHLQASSKSLNQTSMETGSVGPLGGPSGKPNSQGYKKALYIFPITFYVCEIYSQDQLISTQNLTIHNPYTNSYLGEWALAVRAVDSLVRICDRNETKIDRQTNRLLSPLRSWRQSFARPASRCSPT